MDEKTDCKVLEETGDASCVAGASSTSQVAEEGIQSTPHTQNRHAETEEVTFQVQFDSLKPPGVYRRITAQGSQRILDALEDEPILQKIKNDLPKVFLDPTARSKIKGEPNIGSPCSIIAGVGASPEVTDNVWKEALAPQHNNVPIDHTVDGSPSSESRICTLGRKVLLKMRGLITVVPHLK
ncbi:hypothetical protein Bbelb_277200 [Branchiostoma belcheri]|nr:hypothetical protein Bbelb_277200 [Branchiostoma belcheri]